MKKSKKIITIVCILLIISCLYLIIVFKYKNILNINNDLENKLSIYTDKNTKLEETVQNMQEELDYSKNRKCEYTKTFYYLGDYDYVGHIPTTRFIIVDRFQTASPIILAIDTSKFDIEFKYKQNYEITFVTNIKDGISEMGTITKIVETDKQGLDQIQESCLIIE